MDNLIFDYDGTLHDSIHIYAPAFRKAYEYLVKTGYAVPRDWSDTEISRWIGYSAKDMWNAFIPGLPRAERETCSRMIGVKMLRLVDAGRARLYPHAREVLRALHESGYRLIFLSNCNRAYMQAHRQAFSLDKYFDAYFCTEDYGFASKLEIFPYINRQFSGGYTVIGDRAQDMKVGETYHLRSVGCLYGYGTEEELEAATQRVSSLRELFKLLL